MTVSIRLTGRAARWIHLLQDFGHLDTEAMDRLLISVGDLHLELGGEPGGWVDLPLVRRAAAVQLIAACDQAPMPMILEEDWPLLFS